MAATFSRTLRAVESDGVRRWTLQLIIVMILLGAWGVWFLLGRLTANRLNPYKQRFFTIDLFSSWFGGSSD
jgi:hypothetical protein